jgi:hypothetical protein
MVNFILLFTGEIVLIVFKYTCAVSESCYHLKIFARPDLNASLNPTNNTNNKSCFENNSFHTWDNCKIPQVPIVMDLENLTQTDYNYFKNFSNPLDTVQLRIDYFDASTINWASGQKGNAYSNGASKLIIRTPASDCSNHKYKREHAGLKYKELKYGKYRAKIKYPKTYNQYDVWKGINNTFWFSQAWPDNLGAWTKTICPDKPNLGTEFDIEYFPKLKYAGYHVNIQEINNTNKQFNISQWDRVGPDQGGSFFSPGQEDGRIAVGYSNFDHACENVVNYIPGTSPHVLVPFIENGVTKNTYLVRGGGDWNGEISLKSSRVTTPTAGFTEWDDSEIFGLEMCYEVEWKPSEIIMRRGTTFSNMQVVAYFNSNYTVIPNNPMRWVIAQHQLHVPPIGQPNCSGTIATFDWPHSHHFLPLSNTDILGEVYDVTIE